MTTEIEKRFFECFGIEPKKTQQIVGNGVFSNVIEDEYYPEITDRKLLLLLCIANAHSVYGYSDYGGEFLIGTTIEELKENLLKDLIRDENRVREDIKALFEGGGGEENKKGEIGCKYTGKQLDKFAKEIEQMEEKEYTRMADYFSRTEV